MEPIKIYREGKFDRTYWYTLQAKRHIKHSLKQAAAGIDVMFEQHRLPSHDDIAVPMV